MLKYILFLWFMGDSLVSHSLSCVIIILVILFVMDMHKIFLVCFSGGKDLVPFALVFYGSCGLSFSRKGPASGALDSHC